MPPWELEEQPDAGYWISEALLFQSAEKEGEAIAHDIAMKKAAKGGRR